MPLSRLSVASLGSILVLTLFSGCQSVEDGFRYGFGFDPNRPAYISDAHVGSERRTAQSRVVTRQTYDDYDEPRNRGGGTSSASASSSFKRTRYKTSETTPAGTIVERDENGNVVRTGSQSGNTTTYRDTSGKISSSVSRSPAGVDTERDSSGQIVTSSSANPSGDTVTYRDGSGRILGTRYTSPAGNVTYRDATGRITGSDFR